MWDFIIEAQRNFLNNESQKWGYITGALIIVSLVFAYFPQSNLLYLFLANSNFKMLMNIYFLFFYLLSQFIWVIFSTNR